LTALRTSPGNPHIFATSSCDQTLKIWDRRLKSASPTNTRVAVGSTGSHHDYIPPSSGDHNVACVQTFNKSMSEIDCLSWFPDGFALALGCKDSTCRIYDSRCLAQLGAYVGSALRSPCKSVEFSASGRLLFAGYADSKVRVFDLSLHPQADPVFTISTHRREVRLLRRCPSGDAILSGGLDGKLFVYA
jgi:guanine nucleotide-binding protein G(I)/G(S)/G(T) subunit beta-1